MYGPSRRLTEKSALIGSQGISTTPRNVDFATKAKLFEIGRGVSHSDGSSDGYQADVVILTEELGGVGDGLDPGGA